jgi:hypothetical protein
MFVLVVSTPAPGVHAADPLKLQPAGMAAMSAVICCPHVSPGGHERPPHSAPLLDALLADEALLAEEAVLALLALLAEEAVLALLALLAEEAVLALLADDVLVPVLVVGAPPAPGPPSTTTLPPHAIAASASAGAQARGEDLSMPRVYDAGGACG